MACNCGAAWWYASCCTFQLGDETCTSGRGAVWRGHCLYSRLQGGCRGLNVGLSRAGAGARCAGSCCCLSSTGHVQAAHSRAAVLLFAEPWAAPWQAGCRESDRTVRYERQRPQAGAHCTRHCPGQSRQAAATGCCLTKWSPSSGAVTWSVLCLQGTALPHTCRWAACLVQVICIREVLLHGTDG